MSLAYIPAMLAALSGAKPEESGLASGIVNTTYQVGSALGLAAITAVATAYGASQLGNVSALVDGFRAAFVGAALIAVAGAGLALITLRQPAAAPAAVPAEAPTAAAPGDRHPPPPPRIPTPPTVVPPLGAAAFSGPPNLPREPRRVSERQTSPRLTP